MNDPGFVGNYCFISIRRKLMPNPASAKALDGSVSAGTKTLSEAAKTEI